jgi:hypothetical protein
MKVNPNDVVWGEFAEAAKIIDVKSAPFLIKFNDRLPHYNNFAAFNSNLEPSCALSLQSYPE